MAGIDYRSLRSMVSITEVLALLEFAPGSAIGKQWRGRCPLHRSENPRSRSFSVNVAKNSFQCFKCKVAGNQLDLWAAAIDKPLFEAALELCDRLRLEVPWLQPRTEKRNP